MHAQMPAQLEEDPSFELTRGWQRPASQAVDGFCHRAFLRENDAASAALLDSQAGLHAARVLTTRPTLLELSLESLFLRAFLLRRLRLPLPLPSARCRCRAHLDPCVDHLAAARAPAFCEREAALSSVQLALVQRSWGGCRSERACQGLECAPGSLRRPPHRSHCQWPAVVGWRPARTGHNACLPLHCYRPPTQS